MLHEGMTVVYAGSEPVLKGLSVIRGKSSRISRCLGINISFSIKRRNAIDHYLWSTHERDAEEFLSVILMRPSNARTIKHYSNLIETTLRTRFQMNVKFRAIHLDLLAGVILLEKDISTKLATGIVTICSVFHVQNIIRKYSAFKGH